MLIIRLQRAGKKNKADFRLVLAEKTAASQKKFTEVLGSYNPHTKALQVRDQERLNYWLNDQHVEVSATVYNLFVTNDLIKGDKKKAFSVPKKEVEATAEETPAEAPAEAVASDETPSETPAEETPMPETEAPAEVAPEAPAEAAPETPAEQPTETPAEVPAEAPAEETQA